MNDVLKMNNQELEDVLTGVHEKETPALQALVNMMTSPIPKRAGLKLSKEDTAEWAEEIKNVIDTLRNVDIYLINALFVDPCIKFSEQTIEIEKAKEQLKKLID